MRSIEFGVQSAECRVEILAISVFCFFGGAFLADFLSGHALIDGNV